jgi:hypothetical protein
MDLCHSLRLRCRTSRKQPSLFVAVAIGGCLLFVALWLQSRLFAPSSPPGDVVLLEAIAATAGSDFELTCDTASMLPASPPPPGLTTTTGDDVEWSRDCFHIYFDFGTNIGIQIRKLFEPELYPSAPILGPYEEYFGPAAERRIPGAVCAFGVEPNPKHVPKLDAIEKSYNAQGWKTRIFHPAGVGAFAGWLLFESDGAMQNMEWASRLLPGKDVTGDTPGAVRVLDAADLVRRVLCASGTPPAGITRRRKVAMKVDVEGMDGEVIAAMLRRGVLCHVDYLFVEHLDSKTIDALNTALLAAGCPTKIERLDDESFHTSAFPLPTAEAGAKLV